MIVLYSLSTAFMCTIKYAVILEDIQAPLPYDETWNAVNNTYDRKRYEKICDEFGVSPNSDWTAESTSTGPTLDTDERAAMF